MAGKPVGWAMADRPASEKKADLADHLEVFGQVGLLFDGPPGPAGLPFIQSSDQF